MSASSLQLRRSQAHRSCRRPTPFATDMGAFAEDADADMEMVLQPAPASKLRRTVSWRLKPVEDPLAPQSSHPARTMPRPGQSLSVIIQDIGPALTEVRPCPVEAAAPPGGTVHAGAADAGLGPPAQQDGGAAAAHAPHLHRPDAASSSRPPPRTVEAHAHGSMAQHMPLMRGSSGGTLSCQSMLQRRRPQRVQVAAYVWLNDELCRAAGCGDAATAMSFLVLGADVHARADEALRSAATRGHSVVVEMLLTMGAGVHARDNEALRMAACARDVVTVRLLLAHGADVHAREDEALRVATYHRDVYLMGLLLEHGADVHARSDEALLRTVSNGDAALVRLLLEHGADVNAREGGALQVAALQDDEAVVRLLLQWSAGSPDAGGVKALLVEAPNGSTYVEGLTWCREDAYRARRHVRPYQPGPPCGGSGSGSGDAGCLRGPGDGCQQQGKRRQQRRQQQQQGDGMPAWKMEALRLAVGLGRTRVVRLMLAHMGKARGRLVTWATLTSKCNRLAIALGLKRGA